MDLCCEEPGVLIGSLSGARGWRNRHVGEYDKGWAAVCARSDRAGARRLALTGKAVDSRLDGTQAKVSNYAQR